MIKLLLSAMCLTGLVIAPRVLAEPPTPAEIDKFVDQLESKSFAEREKASKVLGSLDEVPPALRAASVSPSNEVAKRAAAAIAQIERGQRERRIKVLLGDINRTGIDFFIDQMVLRKGFATDDRWQNLFQLAEGLSMVAEQMGRTKFQLPKKELAKHPVVHTLPPTVVMQSRVTIDGNSRYNSINNCLVVSSGPLERFTVLQDSILFVNGDIEGVTSIHNSLVFCNGNIGYVTSVDSSIILATGEFKGFTSAEGSLFEIKALGAHNMATNSVFVNVTPTNNNPNMNLRRMGIVENKQVESE